jgi:D-3-phosphoglycerate dehydrogenase
VTFRVVLTDQVFPDVDVERAALAAIDASLVIAGPDDDPIAMAESADALLTTYHPIDAAAIAKLHRCKVIARYGIGVDNIDLDAATRAGIVVTNVPDYSIEEVAAHTLLLILAAVRRLVGGAQLAGSGAPWVARSLGPIPRISELTVGIVGLGRIGQRVAAVLRPLGCRLIGYDPLATGPVEGVELQPDLDAVLARSDVVTLHIPLTADNRHLIRTETIGVMKRGAVLVNTSRGGLVQADDVVTALTSGQLSYAALDVLEREPIDAAKFADVPNALVTPHMAYYSVHAVAESQRKAIAQVVKVLTGEPPDYQVNQEFAS